MKLTIIGASGHAKAPAENISCMPKQISGHGTVSDSHNAFFGGRVA